MVLTDKTKAASFDNYINIEKIFTDFSQSKPVSNGQNKMCFFLGCPMSLMKVNPIRGQKQMNIYCACVRARVCEYSIRACVYAYVCVRACVSACVCVCVCVCE